MSRARLRRPPGGSHPALLRLPTALWSAAEHDPFAGGRACAYLMPGVTVVTTPSRARIVWRHGIENVNHRQWADPIPDAGSGDPTAMAPVSCRLAWNRANARNRAFHLLPEAPGRERWRRNRDKTRLRSRRILSTMTAGVGGAAHSPGSATSSMIGARSLRAGEMMPARWAPMEPDRSPLGSRIDIAAGS